MDSSLLCVKYYELYQHEMCCRRRLRSGLFVDLLTDPLKSRCSKHDKTLGPYKKSSGEKIEETVPNSGVFNFCF